MMGSKVILRRCLQSPFPDAACESWDLESEQPATSSRTGWIDNLKFWVGKVCMVFGLQFLCLSLSLSLSLSEQMM